LHKIIGFQTIKLVNTYCKPYLLYGAEVVNWTSSELSRMNYAYNRALCRLYKISFNSLDVIYGYWNLRSIKSEIELRTTRTFLNWCDNIDNAIVRHVFSVGRVTCVFWWVFIFCVFLSTVL